MNAAAEALEKAVRFVKFPWSRVTVILIAAYVAGQILYYAAHALPGAR